MVSLALAMAEPEQRNFVVSEQLTGQTLATALRQFVGGLSWSAAKRLIVARRVDVDGTLCLNDARRLRMGQRVTVHDESMPPVPTRQDVRIVHLDGDLIVIDKPPGIITLRRDEERAFSEQRKALQPSLDELVRLLISPPMPGTGNARAHRRRSRAAPAPLYAVHRLDRDTSGLMVFALSARARDALIEQFKAHEVRRMYTAVVLGAIGASMTIDTWLVRDRGDGLRGSLPVGCAADAGARRAVTHVRPLEQIGGGRYTLVECQLETGRTHQIRVHLAEAGHMVCGEALYRSARAGGQSVTDSSGAPRQALHSGELRMLHPVTGAAMRFDAPLADDLKRWLIELRRRSADAALTTPAPEVRGQSD